MGILGTVSRKIDEAFDKFSQWGIKGIKMDFMNRDDQEMVDFYYEVARKAAARKMLVDFMGLTNRQDGCVRFPTY